MASIPEIDPRTAPTTKAVLVSLALLKSVSESSIICIETVLFLVLFVLPGSYTRIVSRVFFCPTSPSIGLHLGICLQPREFATGITISTADYRSEVPASFQPEDSTSNPKREILNLQIVKIQREHVVNRVRSSFPKNGHRTKII